MTCENKSHRAKIENGWQKILLPQIFDSAGFFDPASDGRPVIGRNFEFFDNTVLTTNRKVSGLFAGVNNKIYWQ